MQPLVYGINHNTAPLETREKIAFTDKHKTQAYHFLSGQAKSRQWVIISTCNRTEFYTLAETIEAGREALIKMLEKIKTVSFSEIESSLYFYSGFEAVFHLFRVTAGLDSMILGETQVLGQVRLAYEQANEQGLVGKELHGLFQHAVRCAKKVQRETGINNHALSVSYLAVEMIKKELGSFDGRRVLVIGAGKMSRLTLKHLFELGAKDVLVTSRTYQRARDLADYFKGRTVDFSSKTDALSTIDIIISSTGAPHLILSGSDLRKAMLQRAERPLFIIDLAVPRDIDPTAGNLDNVFLYDMDSLQKAVTKNRQEREREASLALNLITAEAEDFQAWFSSLAVTPVIKALRRKADQIRTAETAKCIDRKLWRLNEKEKEAVENLTRSIVNAILKDPIMCMKDNTLCKSKDAHVKSLLYLFGLEEECVQHKGREKKNAVN